MRRLGLFVLPALLAAASCLTGCDDPTDPLSCVAAGRIQGRVTVGGDPTYAQVRASRVVDGVETENVYVAAPDELGHYVLDLPAGDFIVRLLTRQGYRFLYDHTGSGLGYGQVPPDTVAVDAAVSPIGIDFLLGGLTVDLDVSSALEGEQGEVVLHLKDAVATGVWRTYLNTGSARIVDGRATVELAGVLPGEYKVEIVLGRRQYLCYCPYDGEHIWMPGTRDESASPWYRVAADSVVSLAWGTAEAPARITGRISGAWLDMGLSASPEVALVSPDSTVVMGRRSVSVDGVFAVDVQLPGPVKILVSHMGVQQWIGGPDFASATVFDLQPGQTIAGIELVESALLVDARSDKLSAVGPEIHLYDPADGRLLSVADWAAGPDNLVGVPNLWPGDFALYITPSPHDLGTTAWRPQWFDRAALMANAVTVTVGSPGEIVRLDVALERGGTISGAFAAPLPDDGSVYVVVTPQNERRTWGTSYAAAGHAAYSVVGLPDGGYKIGVFHPYAGWDRGDPPPEGTLWYPGTPDWSAAGVIGIQDAGDVTGVALSAP